MPTEKNKGWYEAEALWWVAIGYAGLFIALGWAWLPRVQCIPDPALGSWADWFAAAGSIGAAVVAVGIALRSDRSANVERRQRGDLVAIKLRPRLEGCITLLDIAIAMASSALSIWKANLRNGDGLRFALIEVRDAGQRVQEALSEELVEASMHISGSVANRIAVAVEVVSGMSMNAQAVLNNELDPEQYADVNAYTLQKLIPQLRQASKALSTTLPQLRDQLQTALVDA